MSAVRLRSIMVAVDYTDVLAITLRYNAHHFGEIYIVTDPESSRAVDDLAHSAMVGNPSTSIRVLTTDLFYRDGADFNKWRAMEWGLDQMGRHGWMVLMDADVLWPRDMTVTTDRGYLHVCAVGVEWYMTAGQLAAPRRRMYPTIPAVAPPESTWRRYALHPQEVELAGYSQLFHAGDLAVESCGDCGHPRGTHDGGCRQCQCRAYTWHQTDWRHAGGADSFFQARWRPADRVRPPFEVLHLGPAGHNWCGRVVPYADGTSPPGAGDRLTKVRGYLTGRMRRPPGDRFGHERITEAP